MHKYMSDTILIYYTMSVGAATLKPDIDWMLLKLFVGANYNVVIEYQPKYIILEQKQIHEYL